MITQAILHEMFVYNLDGYLERKSSGIRAGTTDEYGYRRIKIKGKSYKEHRLVWLYHHGCIDKEQIDHINKNRLDNRIENLRECTNAENSQNRGIKKGSYLHSSGKYHVRVRVGTKSIHIGYYETEDEAYDQYIKAKKLYHPFAEIA